MKFSRFAERVSDLSGTALAFSMALAVVLVWFVCGFHVGFGNTLYQLVINTGTTIVTFLMIFLVQNATIRFSLLLLAKLDAILVAVHADAASMALDDLDERGLRQALLQYRHLLEDTSP